MVITVYADRRSHEVANIAGRLACAIAARLGRAQVALVGTRLFTAAMEPGVETTVLSEGLAPQDVSVLLADLAGRYPAAIIALSGALNERVLAAFDASDRVLLLSDPSVASIRGTQRTLKLCASLGYGAEKTAIVLHDFDDAAPFAPADAAIALKREIFFTLPGESEANGPTDDSYARLAGRLMGRN